MRKNVIYSDKTGMKFGKLTVLGLNGTRSGSKNTIDWLCVCDCGNKIVVNSNSLTPSNHKTSCSDCDIRKTNFLTHGYRYSYVYNHALHLLERVKSNKNYVERGILNCISQNIKELCEALMLIPNYFEGAQLDRVDNDGNYTLEHPIHGFNNWIYIDPFTNRECLCIGNLRWSSEYENMMNRRITVTIDSIKTKPREINRIKNWLTLHGYNYIDFLFIRTHNIGKTVYYIATKKNSSLDDDIKNIIMDKNIKQCSEVIEIRNKLIKEMTSVSYNT